MLMLDLFVFIFSIVAPIALVVVGLIRFHLDNNDSTQCVVDQDSKEK